MSGREQQPRALQGILILLLSRTSEQWERDYENHDRPGRAARSPLAPVSTLDLALPRARFGRNA